MDETTPFYRAAVRALGLFDLSPLSRTAGCGDRSFWHYQEGKGFPIGSFQVAMLAFCGAAESFPDERASFDTAAELAARFWSAEILERGPLDEYFPGQQSFCATAHTTLAAALYAAQLKRSGKSIPVDLSRAISRALHWLENVPYRPDSANQSLAARIAWDVAGEGLGGSGPTSDKNPFAPRFSASEGWFSEYEGFDLGYSLQCVDLCALALCSVSSPAARERYAEWAGKLLDVLGLALLDYTFHPSLGSRGNPHGLLGGLSLFAEAGDPKAAAILEKLSRTKLPALVTAESCDDKYFVFFHLTSLLLSHHSRRKMTKVLSQKLGDFAFRPGTGSNRPAGLHPLKEAGLLFYSTKSLKAALSLRQGAAIYAESAAGPSHAGAYLFRWRNRLWRTSSEPDLVTIKTDEDGVVQLHVPLFAEAVSERARFVQSLFVRLVLGILGALPLRWVVSRIILSRVSTRRRGPQVGTRNIVLSENRIEIEDRLSVSANEVFEMKNWCSVDGHSTRQFSGAGPALERADQLGEGSPRRVVISGSKEKVSVKVS